MNSTYIMITVGVLVAIIAAVAIYYFFFTESEKQKDAREFINKNDELIKDQKPDEANALQKKLFKKYPNIMKNIMSDPTIGLKLREYEKNKETEKSIKLLVSIM